MPNVIHLDRLDSVSSSNTFEPVKLCLPLSAAQTHPLFPHMEHTSPNKRLVTRALFSCIDMKHTYTGIVHKQMQTCFLSKYVLTEYGTRQSRKFIPTSKMFLLLLAHSSALLGSMPENGRPSLDTRK